MSLKLQVVIVVMVMVMVMVVVMVTGAEEEGDTFPHLSPISLRSTFRLSSIHSLLFCLQLNDGDASVEVMLLLLWLYSLSLFWLKRDTNQRLLLRLSHAPLVWLDV